MKLGEIDISRIELDLKCRDEIPKLLMGFQYIYTTPGLREEVFNVLERMIPDAVAQDNGRPGMELWRILILGSLRLNCDWDYDKLQDIANNHKTIRAMLGIGEFDRYCFKLNTLKDNVSLLSPAILNEVNEIIVRHAQKEVVKKKTSDIKGHCDSFVVETNVHYPTDVNLLYDAMRKVVILTMRLCRSKGIIGWRQWRHLIGNIKKSMHRIQNVKRGGGKDKEKKEREIKKTHRNYNKLARGILNRAKSDIAKLRKMKLTYQQQKRLKSLENFAKDADRQIDQIDRRVLKDEVIPSAEKVFSIFEPHTEWIVKGKSGITQELGLKVCIIKDQSELIMNHMVMEKLQDVDIAVPFIEETKEKFPNLKSCGFDKGFFSPENREKLNTILDVVVMPKKGKLNKQETENETSQEFVRERRNHSAVESAIAALENHGLDRCCDKGIDGFKRYVALAVLSRNVQTIGHIIQRRKYKALLREQMRARRLWAA